MVHFPNLNEEMKGMDDSSKRQFLQNIDLINTEFEVKIIDFGLSTEVYDLGQTVYGQCGTYLYLSPQAVANRGYTYKVDIWALGILLFHVLAKCTPFEASTRR